MKYLRIVFGACLSTALLTACGSNGNGLSPSTTSVARIGADQSSESLPSPRATVGPNLYVLDTSTSSVTVYAPGSNTVLRTISRGIYDPLDLAFDGTGKLYVANGGCTGSCSPYRPYTVTVYAPESEKVRRTITAGINGPDALAFDSSGNLYVANWPFYSGTSTVTVYAPGSKNVLRTISQGIVAPVALAFDAAGRLYVLNASGNVTVYASGKTTVARTITQGIVDPQALALDASQNLYVANCGRCRYGESGTDAITVYAPGSKTVLRTISDDVNRPVALLFDGSGNLYVANFACPTTFCRNNHEYRHSTVTVYAQGSGSVLRTIRQGLKEPYRFAFDGSGNLYVANYGYNNVTVYAPGSDTVLRTISQGVNNPHALAFGP